MTRDQAALIINNALPDGAQYLAAHIAIALDALGLLALTTDPAHEPNASEQIAAAARIVSGNPLPLDAWAATRKRS
jgi:hypothetical protein